VAERLTGAKKASNGCNGLGEKLAHIGRKFCGAEAAEAVATSRMSCERWIVVGTDFSDGAEEAFEHAVRLAEDSRAKVALVHAYEDAPGENALTDPAVRLLERLADDIAASSATRRGVQVTPLVRRGPPWEKILNVATEYAAELIVVGYSGQREAPRGLPLGSVASRVLALSTRSVLVTRLRGTQGGAR
jgi:nucleotide-binding universal stress UspA family protein